MTTQAPRRRLAADLAAAADTYQRTAVIPHCPTCSKPCCRLDTLVLEMAWRQVKVLWHVDEARTAFNRRLAAGDGPVEIREGNGRYYIHSKPCPAYDTASGACKVYGQDLKPSGCSDFPVYEDEGSVMADLRCEAVDLEALSAALAAAAGPDARIVREADAEFPFLVTLSVRRKRGRR